MSLDDLSGELTRRIAAEVKGRSDYVTAVQIFHLAIVVVLRVLDEDPEMEGLQDRFVSALEVAVSEYMPRLSNDERDQYRRIHKRFLELLDETS